MIRWHIELSYAMQNFNETEPFQPMSLPVSQQENCFNNGGTEFNTNETFCATYRCITEYVNIQFSYRSPVIEWHPCISN